MSSSARKPSLPVMLAPFAVMLVFAAGILWLAGRRGGLDVATGVLLGIVLIAAAAQALNVYLRFTRHLRG